MDNTNKLANIIQENVKDLNNITINELMTVAIKSYNVGQDTIGKMVLNDLDKYPLTIKNIADFREEMKKA